MQCSKSRKGMIVKKSFKLYDVPVKFKNKCGCGG